MLSKANGIQFQIGTFNTPSLKNLRTTAISQMSPKGGDVSFSFDHVVQGDILLEHVKYPGALFQAASQFNCLEFSSWITIPEYGVSMYSEDFTQGPACALACAAGTVYRNYLVDVNNLSSDVDLLHPQKNTVLDYSQLGQLKHRQINNLDELERLIDNEQHDYFNITNDYSFSDDASNLVRLNKVIKDCASANCSGLNYDDLLGSIKIGLHEDVGITFRTRYETINPIEGVTVTQAYCSALSCSYSGIHNKYWEGLARLVLEANYEATMWAGVLNALKTTQPIPEVNVRNDKPACFKSDVFITLLGGGVFQNDMCWICDAIGRALAVMKLHNSPIHVHISHYRSLDQDTVQMVNDAYERFLVELTV